MKEHVQDYGVRKWAGDDLIELQSEPLSALQALVAPYAPCILQGCELETVPDGDGDYRLHAGYVALKGRKTVENGAGGTGDGAETAAETAENEATTATEEYVKIVRVTAQTVKQPTVFLTLACTPLSRAYGNGENKAIAYDYTAEVCDVLSKVSDRPYLELVAGADNPRLPDTLGITQKLDRVGGVATDVVVGFTLPSVRLPLFSGLKLGTLFGQIQRWLKDLRALAFKDKVAKGDLTEELAGELAGKAPSVHSHSEATASSNGFMSKRDKEKLDGMASGATKVIVDSSLDSSSENTVQNKTICSALANKLSLSGGAMTGAITYPTTSTTSHSRYISVGGGYGKNVGKRGLKLLFQEQGDAECGFGCDLTGYNYEACFVGSQKPSNATEAHITFARHEAGTNTYTRLAEIDGTGAFRSQGLIYEAGSRVATQSYVNNCLSSYPKVIAAGHYVSAQMAGVSYLKVGDWSLSRTSTGTYEVTVSGVDLTQCVVLVTALGGFVATLASQSSSGSFVVNTYKGTTLANCNHFYFIVLGF